MRLAAALVSLIVLMVPAAPAVAQATDAGASATQTLNLLRQAAGLAPVRLDSSSAAQSHARYLALNTNSPAIAGLNVHTEQTGLPGYSPDGAAVASRSNIYEGTGSAATAVQALVDVPIHRHWMLAPGLTQIGVGGDGKWWVLDVSQAVQPWTGAPSVVAYPPAGMSNVPSSFSGNEVPNPLAAVPGLSLTARVGYPISLDFWGCDPRNAQASLSAKGANVPIYLIQPGTVLRAEGGERSVPFVLFFPQQPLLPDTTYTASASADCGTLGRGSKTWSFITRPAFDPARTQTLVAAPSQGGEQAVSVQLLNTRGGPVSGAQVSSVKWQFTFLSSGTRQPALKPVDSLESGADGILRLTFNLMDAESADVQLSLRVDGATATVPVKITRAGGGHLSPTSGPAVDVGASALDTSLRFQLVVPDPGVSTGVPDASTVVPDASLSPA